MQKKHSNYTSRCIHGIAIGQLSEEASEARNKDIKKYRQNFTRKSSRINTNTDLLHRLLISSDPYICSLRKTPHTNRGMLIPEVRNLLNSPDNVEDCSDSE